MLAYTVSSNPNAHLDRPQARAGSAPHICMAPAETRGASGSAKALPSHLFRSLQVLPLPSLHASPPRHLLPRCARRG